MSFVRAEIDTFYGDFPAVFDFTLSENEEINGQYSFIGYAGAFSGHIVGEDGFEVSGTVDSYIGKIEFTIRGSVDHLHITGNGVTDKHGTFTIRGMLDAEIL